MQKIKYLLCQQVNVGTDEEPKYEEILYGKKLPYSEANLEIAKAEAYNGDFELYDDGVEEKPSQLDIIEAQVVYTAMMTDTLLEG